MDNSTFSISCSPSADAAFGPVVEACRDDFDFTIAFEQYMFTILPASVLLVAAPVRLGFLSKRRALVAGNPLRIAKLASLSILATLQLTLGVLWALQPTELGGLRTASIAACFVSLVASLLSCVLSYVEHAKSLRPSLLLNVYLAVSVLLDAAILRTFWLTELPLSIRAVFTTSFALKLLILVLEAQEKGKSILQGSGKDSPEATAGFFSQSSMWWLNTLLLNGFRRLLTPSDLYALDESMGTALLSQQFWYKWNNTSAHRKHKLVRVCVSTLRWPLLSVVVPRLLSLAFTIIQPLLLNALLAFLQDSGAPARVGYGLIGAYGLVYLGISFSASLYGHRNFRSVTMLRTLLMSAIFAKSTDLRLTTDDKAAPVTLMSTDVDAIVRAMRGIHDFWANIIQIAVVSWLLSRQLGFAAVGPIIVCVVSLGLTFLVGPYAQKYMMAWIGKVQTRIGITSTVLGHMKSLKMSGLGPVLTTRIAALRQNEIDAARPFRVFGAVTSALAQMPTMVSTVVGFALFCSVAQRSGDTLDVQRMFASLSLILLLGNPLFFMFETILDLNSARGCITRIEKFLQEGSREEYRIALEVPSSAPASSLQNQEPAGSTAQLSPAALDTEMRILGKAQAAHGASLEYDIEVDNATIAWNTDQPIVKNLNLQVRLGQLVMIVGPVASGKSTLLKGLLGEAALAGGQVRVANKKHAWCEQTPWLTNDTVKNNIIGFSHFDADLYNQVVRACELEKDLRQLENGDETKVGSKGTALSGGQKQRIAIARALYSRPGIAFFDDVFSSIDGTTAKAVFRNVFDKNGLLGSWGTTIVLATQSSKLIPSADYLVALSEDGHVAEQGHPLELLAADTSVIKSLVGAHQKEDDSVSESVTDETPQETDSKAKAPAKAAVLTDTTRQTGDTTIWRYFFGQLGLPYGLGFLAVELLWAFLSTFPSVWLNWWAQSNEEAPNQRIGHFLGGYAGLQIAGVLSFGIMVCFGTVIVAARVGLRLHHVLLDAVMRAPLALFTTVDVGSITSRFSQDINMIDRQLPLGLIVSVANLFSVIAMAALVALATGYVAICFPVLIAAFFYLQSGYLRTSRQLRFLDLEEKAPVYTQFLETVSGLATIRAFGWEAQAKELNHGLVDKAQKPFYLLLMVQQWLTLVLDLMVAALAVLVVGLAVRLRESVSPGLTGVSLVQLITFAETVKIFIQFWTSLETSIGAVARIRGFSRDVRDENLPGEGHGEPLLAAWPAKGRIVLDRVSARYDSGWENNTNEAEAEEQAQGMALDGISLSFEAGEKIGICGRTGSGKSSLLLALLRLLELSSGSITIDGLDLRTLRRQDVRARLLAVTQDHFLLPGTVRENLDPYGACTDSAPLEVALARVGLWDTLLARGGLDVALGEDALSHGQWQLFSLARALVRKTLAGTDNGAGGILLLDEATSSVDAATERRMQELVRVEFADYTVIAIAHRLDTIVDFDRVVVLERGCVAEQGRPDELLARETGRFKALWDASGGRRAETDGDVVSEA